MAGPQVRTDIVEVYVLQRHPRGRGVQFLQLKRRDGKLAGSWQPVMGHVEGTETAWQTARRELQEETGLTPLRCWQLELVNCYFLAKPNEIMLSPGFAVEVAWDSKPVLDGEHDAFRWVKQDHADEAFLWPGQRAAIAHIMRDLLTPGSRCEPLLALPLETPAAGADAGD